MAVGYAGYGTPEQVRRRREIADALMANVFRGGQAPRSVGDALSQGGSQFGAALASRGIRRKADKAEREGRESARGTNRDAIARALSGLSGGQSAAPVSPPAQNRGGAVQPSSAPAQEFSPAMAERAINEPPVDTAALEGVDPRTVDALGNLQASYGQPLNVTSGLRSPEHNARVGGAGKSRHMAEQGGDAVDIDTSGMSDAEKQQLLQQASAQGFTGIGVYDNSIHLDRGPPRAWGPSYGRESVPQWAQPVVQAHLAGDQGARMAQGPAASMTDAGPQGGQPAPRQQPAPQPGQPAQQPPAAQPDMEYVQGLATVLENPWSSEGDKAMAQMLLEQHMAQMAPPEPMSQYERARLGMDQKKLGFEREKFGAQHGMDRERLELEREKARSTGDLTEYDRYVEQQKARGQEPLGFLEYQQALKGGGTSLRVGPEGEIEFSQGGPGGVDRTSAGTPGRTKLDKEYAKRFDQWVMGGRYDSAKNLTQLETALQKLESGDANLTGAFIGLLPDSVKAMTNPEAVDVQELVAEVVQRNLREVLGAQFTEKEGEMLISRAYNPQLDEATNAKRLRRLVEQMKEAYQANESAARYFQENGTLRGWSGKLYRSVDDFDLSAKPSREEEDDIEDLLRKYE